MTTSSVGEDKETPAEDDIVFSASNEKDMKFENYCMEERTTNLRIRRTSWAENEGQQPDGYATSIVKTKDILEQEVVVTIGNLITGEKEVQHVWVAVPIIYEN